MTNEIEHSGVVALGDDVGNIWSALQDRIFLCGHRETFKQSFDFVLGEALARPAQETVAIELEDVTEQLSERSGAWLSCTGCHETSEGVPTGPYSSTLKCHLGGGCRECGGIGAVWDNADYSHYAEQAITKIAQVSSTVGWQSNEPAMELAGQIVSVLAAHPEHIERFMRDGSELFLDGTFNIENGSLTYRAANGDIFSSAKMRTFKGLQQ